MTHDEMIAVIAAHRDGKAIQFSSRYSGQSMPWGDYTIDGPSWNFSAYDYRIKPEPLECWVNVNNAGQIYGPFDSNSAACVCAQRIGDISRIAVHMREVV